MDINLRQFCCVYGENDEQLEFKNHNLYLDAKQGVPDLNKAGNGFNPTNFIRITGSFASVRLLDLGNPQGSIFHCTSANKREGNSASLFLRMLAIPNATPANIVGKHTNVHLITYCDPLNGHQVRVENDSKFSKLCGDDENLVKINNIEHTIIYEVVGIGYHISIHEYQLIYCNVNVFDKDKWRI